MKQTTAREDFAAGVFQNNPIFGQFLGLCPTLAVTNLLANGLAMGLATTFVLLFSNVLIAALKQYIPNEVRITAYVLIIATFVTLVDLVMAGAFPELHHALGAFIALIVVNCIILGRAEAFAAKNTVTRSILDALGNGLGFTGTLILMSGARELLGSGTLLGFQVMPQGFEPWVIMVMPPGGFFTLGFYLLLFGWWKERQLKKAGVTARAPRRWRHQVTVQQQPREVVA